MNSGREIHNMDSVDLDNMMIEEMGLPDSPYDDPKSEIHFSKKL